MESKQDDYQAQIDISKYVRAVVETCREKKPERYSVFTKWFHLRPCASYVTIVTTHNDRPMRGIAVAKSKLVKAMDYLVDFIGVDNSKLDWSKPHEIDRNNKGFDIGSPNNEFKCQAQMINNLQNDVALKKLLGVRELYFVGSEIVLARQGEKRNRIDIVAHDGTGKVIFFELKSPENVKDDSVDQVKRYLNLYGKGGDKNNVFERMMEVYPQNPITNIKECAGYGIIGYGEEPTLKDEMLIAYK